MDEKQRVELVFVYAPRDEEFIQPLNYMLRFFCTRKKITIEVEGKSLQNVMRNFLPPTPCVTRYVT